MFFVYNFEKGKSDPLFGFIFTNPSWCKNILPPLCHSGSLDHFRSKEYGLLYQKNIYLLTLLYLVNGDIWWTQGVYF